MERVRTKDLVIMAVYIALFIVFDVFVNMIPLFQMPNGGSWGLSTVPLLMASYHLGWKKGLIIAMLSVLLMFMTGPMYTPDLLGFLLDYLFAFSVYGLASFFPNYKYLYTGVLITNIIRFISSTISGIVVWGVPLWGSITYQAYYMIPTLLLGMVLVPLLHKRLENIINK